MDNTKIINNNFEFYIDWNIVIIMTILLMLFQRGACCNAKGVCQVKKIQKSEKNSEAGGWVTPTRIFYFAIFRVFVLFSCFQMFPKNQKKMDRRVGGCTLINPSFSRISGFLNLQDS